MMRKAVALLALGTTVGMLTVGAASAKQADIPIAGAGSSLVNPLVQQFVPAVGQAFASPTSARARSTSAPRTPL